MAGNATARSKEKNNSVKPDGGASLADGFVSQRRNRSTQPRRWRRWWMRMKEEGRTKKKKNERERERERGGTHLDERRWPTPVQNPRNTHTNTHTHTGNPVTKTNQRRTLRQKNTKRERERESRHFVSNGKKKRKKLFEKKTNEERCGRTEIVI